MSKAIYNSIRSSQTQLLPITLMAVSFNHYLAIAQALDALTTWYDHVHFEASTLRGVEAKSAE
jgi:hypothetical protein